VNWEAEAAKAAAQRTVVLRLGIVLDNGGGAMAKMLPIFQLGAGGPLGGGKQWFSWIHRDDVVSMLVEAIANPQWEVRANAVHTLREDGGDRSRGRFATPADFLLHDCSPYSHVHVRRESLGFVPRSRTIFCRPVPSKPPFRFATCTSLCCPSMFAISSHRCRGWSAGRVQRHRARAGAHGRDVLGAGVRRVATLVAASAGVRAAGE
jgi:hypothetical protein